MRVLYINHTIYKSGASISLGTLIRNLHPDVESYFILRPKNEVEDIIAARGRPVFFERWMPQFMTVAGLRQYPFWLFVWHLLKMPIAFFNLLRAVRRWRIQLIHLNETTLTAYAFMAGFLNIPVVVHARAAITRSVFGRFFLKMAANLKNVGFIAIDEEVKLSLPANCRSKTRLIYNPVDLGQAPGPEEIKNLRALWGCNSSDCVVIGQVSSLHSVKGVWQIVGLAEKICAAYPQARFVFIGDDRPQTGEGPQLRKALADKHLNDRVILAGYRSDLSVVYGALDIVLCFFSERLGGAGRSAYEAAIAARPLIATLDNPEVSDTLKSGVIGMVLRPDDNNGIMQALKLLIESEAARSRLGEQARQAIGNRHLPSVSAGEVALIYKRLIMADQKG